MQGNSMSGLPAWLWVLLAIVVVIVAAVVVNRTMARGGKRAEAEKLAQHADAEHEGAQTRHEGGA